jgi:hypothetical protein
MGKGHAGHGQPPARREVNLQDLHAVLDRVKIALGDQDYETLKGAVDTLAVVTATLESKEATVARLRLLLFGPKTEKTRQVLPDANPNQSVAAGSGTDLPAGGAPAAAPAAEQAKRPGHGRVAAAAYQGATRVPVPHESLKKGDPCPECPKGKLYTLKEPALIVRVKGMAPLVATVYEAERLRCNLCGAVFTAATLAVGTKKYDETAAAMIGLLTYGTGLPFYRLEKLQRSLGIPLPAATQWEVVRGAAQLLAPAHAQLIYQAAQGEVLHNDDTPRLVLSLVEKPKPANGADREKGADAERTGIFTSGVVSVGSGHRIALYFTGREHAGENLAKVLAQRGPDLAAPIQMCDGLSRNVPKAFQTILASCMVHARRNFVEVVKDFPEDCRYLLETLRDVYKHDEEARTGQMTPAERLAWHQAKSGPLMDDLKQWLDSRINEHLVEPNSGLGQAIEYMRKHWLPLTLFLREPGAPLDNSLAERTLKRAILHRKNSYFYKTENGARVGDTLMSLIHSAELNYADPFDYLVELLRHAEQVTNDPADWMPWNYREAVARCAAEVGTAAE